MELLVDILMASLAIAVTLVIWTFIGAFVVMVVFAFVESFQKRQAKKPKKIPTNHQIFNGNTGKWLTYEEYEQLLKDDSRVTKPMAPMQPMDLFNQDEPDLRRVRNPKRMGDRS